MGYCLTTLWNFTEFEKEGVVSISESSNLGVHKAKGNGFVDLKLGRLGNSRNHSAEKVKDLGSFEMETSSSGSSKRARAPGNGSQVTSCLVDGCNSDLSKCRDYHRRHKVCELHSKTPKVTIAGQEQRFCQQCSRFHSLEEFDEGKRSCRKRLDGHNRRRRKSQPDSLSLTSGRFLSNHQGARFLGMSSSQIFPSTAAVSSSWSGAIKPENEAMLYSSHSHSQLNFKDSFPGSSSHSYKAVKQFPFLQVTDSTLPGILLDPNSSSGNGGSTRRMFSNGFNQVVDHDRALSLLSSPPSETREIGFGHMLLPSNSIPPAQSLIPGLHYNNGLRIEGDTVDSVLVSDISSNANFHSQGRFQIEPDGSSASAPHQTLSFSWE